MNARARILIVDDEPNVRLMFRTTLESHDYLVQEAIDGETALERLRSESFDLLLLDLQMPRLDGLATLSAMRDEGRTVPGVIITAHGSVPDAVKAMRLGAIDFLSKPITPDALRGAVSDVVRRNRQEVTAATMEGRESREEPFEQHLNLAKKALNQRHFDEGLQHLREATLLNPRSAEAHNLLGVLHELRREHDASYREYRDALKANRHYRPAVQNMKRYYERFTFGRSQVPFDLGDN